MDRRGWGPDDLRRRAAHGAGPAIARFSVAHHITGPPAWVTALVVTALADALTRLVVTYLRGRRLTATPANATPVRVGAVPDLAPRPAAGQTVLMRARLAAAGPVRDTARPDPHTACCRGPQR